MRAVDQRTRVCPTDSQRYAILPNDPLVPRLPTCRPLCCPLQGVTGPPSATRRPTRPSRLLVPFGWLFSTPTPPIRMGREAMFNATATSCAVHTFHPNVMTFVHELQTVMVVTCARCGGNSVLRTARISAMLLASLGLNGQLPQLRFQPQPFVHNFLHECRRTPGSTRVSSRCGIE